MPAYVGQNTIVDGSLWFLALSLSAKVYNIKF